MIKYSFLTYLLFCIGGIYGRFDTDLDKGKEKEKIKQVKKGNFALPTSQQPGPLIGFGQNILDRGDLQLFTYVDCLKGDRKSFFEIAPSLLYAFNDAWSLFIEVPIASRFKLNKCSSHGLEDLVVQFEYAIYDKDTLTTADQMTLVVNITAPTGKPLIIPPTGFGSPSVFLAFTASHAATDWYYFTSGGITITTSHNGTKFGNQLLYQFGLSKNITYGADEWILNWMIELDGIYKQRNKICGKIDPNSGGNEILFGPSLWFSTQQLILQGGISSVISQHLFGVQNKDKYYLAVNAGWKF